MNGRHFSYLAFLLGFLLFSAIVVAVGQSSDSDGKKSSRDALVVAAGTEIRVSIVTPRPEMRPPYVVTGKVVLPVRVGFDTAIPATSVATVSVTPIYQEYEDGKRRHFQQVANLMELTSVVVSGVVYEVKTGAVLPITSAPGLDSEIGFALQQPLHIARE